MTHLTTADGTEIHYEIAGGGAQPLLFVHGWCSNLNHWRRQVRHFARRHRVIAVDRRGHGRSAQPKSPRELNAALHAADVAAVAHKEGIRGAIVVGHAGGGPATLELARTYPELARAVVMVDAGVYPKPRMGHADDPFGARLGGMIEALSSVDGAQRFREIYATFFGPHCDKALVTRAVADAARTPLAIAIAELKQTIGVSTQAIARGVKQPVLFVTATAADQAYVRSALRRVEFAQVAGSGHFVQLEVPAQLNAMIDTFVAQLD
jgi:pimeloyl-ACP methyl ester carboxylesterase